MAAGLRGPINFSVYACMLGHKYFLQRWSQRNKTNKMH